MKLNDLIARLQELKDHQDADVMIKLDDPNIQREPIYFDLNKVRADKEFPQIVFFE